MKGLLLLLALTCSLGCDKEEAAVAGRAPLRREEAFQSLAAMGVTLGAAYMTAHDEAGANQAIETCVALAGLGRDGQFDLAEAGRLVEAVERARGRDGMVTIDKARPIVVRAKELLAHSRAAGDGKAR